MTQLRRDAGASRECESRDPRGQDSVNPAVRTANLNAIAGDQRELDQAITTEHDARRVGRFIALVVGEHGLAREAARRHATAGVDPCVRVAGQHAPLYRVVHPVENALVEPAVRDHREAVIADPSAAIVNCDAKQGGTAVSRRTHVHAVSTANQPNRNRRDDMVATDELNPADGGAGRFDLDRPLSSRTRSRAGRAAARRSARPPLTSSTSRSPAYAVMEPPGNASSSEIAPKAFRLRARPSVFRRAAEDGGSSLYKKVRASV